MKKSEKYVFYDSPLGRFAVEFFKGEAYLHLKMKAWSIEAMREVRRLAPGVLACLAHIGHRRVYAYNREGDAKWPRFMALFGFRAVRRNNGWILMERKNG